MFGSMEIGASGLAGFSNGLKVVSNNIANLNTPGFKRSQVLFGDALRQQFIVGGGHAGGYSSTGQGLAVLGTPINFAQGDSAQTGNPLDAAISGEGFFVLREGDNTHYSRSGQFEFNDAGVLVSKTTKMRVAGLTETNGLTDISLDGYRTHLPQPTTAVKFVGNLSTSSGTHTLDSVKVFDLAGVEHTLKVEFQQGTDADINTWTVKLSDTSGVVGTGTIKFINGTLDPSTTKVEINYAPTGGSEPFTFNLDFAADVTAFSAGSTSTLNVASQDGYIAGFLTATTFDKDGALSLTYSNGKTRTGPKLALATFSSNDGLIAAANSEFTYNDSGSVRLGKANVSGLGEITASSIEGSNVEISDEFSELIIMQRGYQACSRVVSTANQMLQDLFDMKSGR